MKNIVKDYQWPSSFTGPQENTVLNMKVKSIINF